MVNAIQRQAAIVVKKSLQEGFGLGVTEARWKARPVVASAVVGVNGAPGIGRAGRRAHQSATWGCAPGWSAGIAIAQRVTSTGLACPPNERDCGGGIHGLPASARSQGDAATAPR